ncbi:Sak single strand annealing protein [Lactobacillus bombicola]|uniref:DUF1071 domain-containing protein n=1 Tax=Lactobacillus bombicola TaxID=1505723 RepID=A0ABX9LWR7_9LACO|nr:DUF1071 domain-containing protein [Lactobacillus bombicola]RHW48861.1 DUF1071 domain-containing protein [Lactobacillus bombicola]RHW53582.1 DUF1071 domain-containing protein [Lactobacillus bombicola]
MTEEKKSVFATLSEIDVKRYLDKKGRLDYLSWANAWTLVKRAYPDANYKITEFPEYVLTKDGWVATGRNVDYRQTAAGYEVEAVVTIEGQDYSSKLFVMDYRNKALSKATYFDINKTQQRALVKALAIAGLGLSVYAGEDLPEEKSNGQVSKPRPVRQSSAKLQFTDQQLLDYEITDKKGTVKLVQVVAEAINGNPDSAATIKSLGGESHEAYKQIYARKLYKSWLDTQQVGE